MLVTEPRALFKKLTPTCTRALEVAAGACVTGQHYEVTVEHLLATLLDDRESDVATVLDHFRVDRAGVGATLHRYVGELRTGNAGKPVFSQLLLELMQDAWVYASVEQGEGQIRSGALLVRILGAPNRYLPFVLEALEPIPRDELRKCLGTVAGASAEAARLAETQGSGGAPAARRTGAVGADPEGPLARFTTDLTQKAKDGLIDPIFGRERGDPADHRHPRAAPEEQPDHRRRLGRRQDGARRGPRAAASPRATVRRSSGNVEITVRSTRARSRPARA